MNPFNNQPHSEKYRKILASRKKFPMFSQMTEFYEMVSYSSQMALKCWVLTTVLKFTKHQIMVVDGETGSGKTTQ